MPVRREHGNGHGRGLDYGSACLPAPDPAPRRRVPPTGPLRPRLL